MHYAIISETWPPEVNGVALTVRALAGGLEARGHRVTVVRPRQSRNQVAPLGTRLVGSLPLPRYPGLRMGRPAGAMLRRAWGLERPDAVYVATEGPLGNSALDAARALGIPVATGLHTRFDHYMGAYGAGLLRGVALAWMRHFHNRGQATLVPTRELQEELAALGFRQVRRLARAVDTAQFRPSHRDRDLRAGWNAGPDDPVLLHVGRLAPEKNLALAIRAHRAVQARLPGARMVLVGDGPLRDALAREHPDLVFAGTRRGADLARHYASADLFVFPSLTETFGNVTLEAMASGLPVVAHATGAAGEHVADGRNGATVPPGAEDAFVSACVHLATEAELRRAMGVAARRATGGLDPAAVAADFDRLLQSLALEAGHGSRSFA